MIARKGGSVTKTTKRIVLGYVALSVLALGLAAVVVGCKTEVIAIPTGPISQDQDQTVTVTIGAPTPSPTATPSPTPEATR